MTKHWIITYLLAAVFAVSCSRREPDRVSPESSKTVTVAATPVSVERWPATYESTGTVRARVTALVSSKLAGYIERVAVQQGDRVGAGQLLITIDARDLETNVRRAKAALAEASSGIAEADAGAAAA